MRLFKVVCRGMTNRVAGSPAHGVAYVVAEDSAEAYRTVRADLDARDLGFTNDREMGSVELVAADEEYPSCGTRLYMASPHE